MGQARHVDKLIEYLESDPAFQLALIEAAANRAKGYHGRPFTEIRREALLSRNKGKTSAVA